MESRRNVSRSTSHVAVPHTSGCMPAIMDVPIVEGNVKRLIKCWSEKYLGVQQGLMNTIHEVEINYCPDTAKNTHTSKIYVPEGQLTKEEGSSHPKVKEMVKIFDDAGKTLTESKEGSRSLKLSQSQSDLHSKKESYYILMDLKLKVFELQQQVVALQAESLAVFTTYEQFMSIAIRIQANMIAEQEATLEKDDEVKKETGTEVDETRPTAKGKKRRLTGLFNKKWKIWRMNKKVSKHRLNTLASILRKDCCSQS
ncbi:uncharacterized protein LOC110837802 isoform X2 [Zootermopsis nevadensis]|uniref:uncharacterized protein LOC110837802 isoform X2 n=1 Tax=Zootermopsis nevadensis TaxID=136037 RepID=UPI000B8EC17A|nr:uncharacterized protein LOC110837802 isoform X2 [Zootermopsis nevadensis]